MSIISILYIYTYPLKKRVNYGKIHSKLPNFCVKSEKIYTGQKKFTRYISGVRDRYEVCLRLPTISRVFKLYLMDDKDGDGDEFVNLKSTDQLNISRIMTCPTGSLGFRAFSNY